MEVKLSRISTLGIFLGLVYALAGIISAYFEPPYHIALLGLGVGLLFPSSIYITFTGSLKSGLPRRGMEAVTPILAVLAASLAPPYSLISLNGGLTLGVLAVILLGAHVYFQVVDWRRRESRLLFFYPVFSGVVGLTVSIIRGYGVIERLAISGVSIAVSMVYTVSLTTIARNYGFDPSRRIAHTPFALLLLGLAIYAYDPGYSLSIISTSMILYYLVLGIHRAAFVLERARRGPPVLAATFRYMVTAHILSLLASIGALYSSLTGNILIAIHYIFIGFIGLHILLHAPLMLPQITGVILRKNYNPSPLILLALASIIRGVQGEASLALVVASLVVAFVQFRPVGLIEGAKKRLKGAK